MCGGSGDISAKTCRDTHGKHEGENLSVTGLLLCESCGDTVDSSEPYCCSPDRVLMFASVTRFVDEEE